VSNYNSFTGDPDQFPSRHIASNDLMDSNFINFCTMRLLANPREDKFVSNNINIIEVIYWLLEFGFFCNEYHTKYGYSEVYGDIVYPSAIFNNNKTNMVIYMSDIPTTIVNRIFGIKTTSNIVDLTTIENMLISKGFTKDKYSTSNNKFFKWIHRDSSISQYNYPTVSIVLK